MSEIEWVELTNWENAKRHSIVQLRRGLSFIQAECVHSDDNSMLLEYRSDGVGLKSRREYKSEGWSLFVEAPPAVVLPTKPGLYSDRDGDAWLLDVYGDWVQLTEVGLTDDLIAGRDAADYVPFNRLEAVPETAKKVLDAIGTWLFGACLPEAEETLTECVKRLRADFGVEVDQ